MSTETSSAVATLVERARAFRDLHSDERVLVLPNAWDSVSARLIERSGAAAVATTSAGVSWALGAADGEQLGRAQALELIGRVVDAVDVPVTADIECGYADDAAGVAATIRDVLAAGAVGVNLEDAAYTSDGPPVRPADEQAERIAAARRAADEAGVPLFINARTDIYLRAAGTPATQLAETLDRAAAYLAAGADGIFVPGVVEPAVVAALARGIAAPLNITVGPGAPSVGELARLGVARVSVGAGIAQAAHALTQRAARELLTTGTYASLANGLAHPELGRLFARP
ncbi:isocitrate lyase/PEP mutase family protein [Streptomyces zagrosensis]|uniref:2-methylisocitrate lyase-like PEP mutase family enzyme n=1 Tax=Streptomyces zagrosensis TaxID=1042984 RepID=A0A7W9QBV3_9ACTN|nr:isocitrate lyase/phosphoenolpyruvate mutase family protein [Streptomyces zagrosensis]MBB5937280.1 2-methylisocitrate lyase-like PEP mutase family enzyme [Streptomyces zagrosensis]